MLSLTFVRQFSLIVLGASVGDRSSDNPNNSLTGKILHLRWLGQRGLVSPRGNRSEAVLSGANLQADAWVLQEFCGVVTLERVFKCLRCLQR